MTEYKTGLVYKIIHGQSDIVYVGSTMNSLRNRWQNHKQDFRKKINKLSIYEYFEKYGIDNFKIILIKKYEVIDRKHLKTKEQLWISKLKCININNSFGLPLVKHYRNIYNNENKQRISLLNKEYRNTDKCKEQRSKRIKCECGTTHRAEDKARHKKSKRHLNFINNGIVSNFERKLST